MSLPIGLRAVRFAGLASMALLSLTLAMATETPRPPAPQSGTRLFAGDLPVVSPPSSLPTTDEGSAVPAPSGSWVEVVSNRVDDQTLIGRGMVLPPGANVFAARIVDGGPSPAYVAYEAGGGGLDSGFFPASTVKVLAAVGALELLHSHGFTGAAVMNGGYSIREFYDAALRHSSNSDYDELVRIAGVDWLNRSFLPSRGYRSTRIQRAYGEGDQVAESPVIEIAEGDRTLTLPERRSDDDYGCGGSNCSNLLELVDALRRVVLSEELPPDDRFAVSAADVVGLREALRGAESWIGPGVREVLGPDATTYSKPGWATGRDCVDIGLVTDSQTGRRYLIGVSAPDDGECSVLAELAAGVLGVLREETGGEAVRSDGTVVRVADGRQVTPG